ncbi:MAG: ribose-phosphate pyrophosphokinase [Deltaproteobacteria bacterium]|nr:ribose-phosphate pyrophosphokinase [Deltaproteobacteria bacterium]MCL5276979.1 ribose-phosphate pyrophosphokinase [Deltaproteobacteria bacterium]
MNGNLKIFSGSSNKKLTEDICKNLNLYPGDAMVKTFSDGESRIEINENVRGMDVFAVQSLSIPGNHHIMELLIMIDALKRASAKRVTAVIPYYGYARQDRKVNPRTPISAKLVADLLTTAGAHRILTVDLHAGQIQGFFNIPVDNLFAMPVLLEYIKGRIDKDIVVVSPDAGGVERARAFAKRLDASIAIIDKRRPGPNVSEVMNIIGDVGGRNALIVDDIVDTAGTMTQAVEALMRNGAAKVFGCTTHAVLSGNAIDKINGSSMSELIVTDTIRPNERTAACRKIVVKSIAHLLAEAIIRIHEETSVSSLFV